MSSLISHNMFVGCNILCMCVGVSNLKTLVHTNSSNFSPLLKDGGRRGDILDVKDRLIYAVRNPPLTSSVLTYHIAIMGQLAQ